MSSRPRLCRAVRAVLATLVLSGALGLAPSAPAAAATPDSSNPPSTAGGQSNGVSTPPADQADLEFPGLERGPVGGAAKGGYVMASSDGKIYTFGGAAAPGEPRDFRLTKPVVDIAGTPSGEGYWLVASDGGIFTFGDAAYFGSLGNLRLNKPIVGMAGTPTGRGYWMVAADGGIFSFGDAAFYGSTGDLPLKERITGMAATPTGRGYWLVAADGGIFSFGDATFKGSTGNLTLAQPIVGMAATATGNGYWMVASDGGIFTFGDATFKGSTGNIRLAQPIVGMAATATGNGYWLGAADGGVFTFGDADFKGSMAAGLLNGRIVGMMPQGGDVRAPVLRHLAFGPTKIDTSNGPATIKFRANITDDLSGHGVDPALQRGDRGETQVIFANPAGQLTHLGLNVFFRDNDRIAGDRLDGIYRAYGTVPANSPPGIWRLSSITMSDGVGNRVSIDGAVLAQAGFPTTFEQVGAGDAEAPQVTALSVTPDRIDTSHGPAEVRVSARVVDNGTGVRSANAGFSNRNTNTGAFLQLVSGDEHDGVYEGTVTIPRYAHQGWWAAGLQVLDGAGNINGFGANFPSAGFTQTGPGDETPPSVVSVTVGPPSIDTSASAATVTVTVHVVDDLSGMTTGDFAEPWMRYQVWFLSPSQQSVEGQLRFVSGTDRDAVYEATITVPRYSEQGTWRLNQVSVRDNALNWSQPQVADPPTFEVVRTQDRP